MRFGANNEFQFLIHYSFPVPRAQQQGPKGITKHKHDKKMGNNIKIMGDNSLIIH